MQIFEIKNQKEFTNKLFIDDVFDNFLLVEAVFVKDYSVSIDGHKADELEGDEYILWKDAKSMAFAAIKGSTLPKSFKIVLKLSSANAIKTMKSLDIGEGVSASFYINIKYFDGVITVTSGTSTASFLLSKDLEKGWDHLLEKFLILKGLF